MDVRLALLRLTATALELTLAVGAGDETAAARAVELAEMMELPTGR